MTSEVVRLKHDVLPIWPTRSRPEAHPKYLFSRANFIVTYGREELIMGAESIADVDLYLLWRHFTFTSNAHPRFSIHHSQTTPVTLIVPICQCTQGFLARLREIVSRLIRGPPRTLSSHRR